MEPGKHGGQTMYFLMFPLSQKIVMSHKCSKCSVWQSAMHLFVVAVARKRKVTKMMQGLFSPFSFHAVSCCLFFVLGAQSARVALGPCIEHRGIVTEFSSSDSSVVSDDDFA